MDADKLAIELLLKGMTQDQQTAALESIKESVAKAKAVQKQRIGENVQVVVQALKKLEADIRSRYDEVGNKIEKRVATIKDGQDGRNGVNGKDGKDGRPGRDGGTGPRGADGLNGRDGRDGDDGVSVTDAHIDFDGSLIISLSSGRTINVGEVVAPDLAEKIKVITNGGGTSQQVLDTLASLQTQIDNLIPSQTGNAGKFLTTNGSALSWGSAVGGLSYEGTWNASTNTPTLASGTGTNGYYYVVATAGSTNLDGITDWQIGDWLIFNGTVWQKIDQSNLVTSVAGRTGAVVLANTDISGLGTMSTQNANAVAITGGTATLTSLTVNDNTTLGSSNTDTINFVGRINSDFDPATDNTYDLGRVGHEWRDLYIDGTANIDSLVADTADINGGSIDGTSVGATTASTGAFTTLAASGTTTLSGNQIISVTDNSNAALRITQLGTGNALLVEDSTNPDASPFVIDASGNVGIGTSSPTSKLVVGDNATTTAKPTVAITDTTSGASITLRGQSPILSFDVTSAGVPKILMDGAGIEFKTGTLDAQGDVDLKIDSSGNLGLGVTPSAWSTLRGFDIGTTGSLSSHSSGATDSAFVSGNAYFNGTNWIYKATSTATQYKMYGGVHSWYTAPSGTAGTAVTFTQAMTLDSSGNLLVGKTATTITGVGIGLIANGKGNFTVDSDEVLNVNRLTNDGNLIRFYQASTEEGNISVSGTTVSYNGGHLSRWAQTTAPKDNTLLKGTVLSNLDAMNVYTDADGNPVDNEQLNKVKVSDVEGDANVAGVFVNWTHDDQHNVDEINMAMTGDMIIRIAQGTTVSRGDLLMSAGDGTAKPQGDDIVRAKTIAKVTSTHVTCTYADGSYCVPCVLMAC
jgi:hypothetical protein